MRMNSFVTLAVSVLSAFTISTTLSQKAMAEGCSNATFKGNYGISSSGFAGTQAPFTPFSGVSIINFDGRGNFTVNGKVSAGGKIQENLTSGTYIVKSDCTFTASGTPIAGSPNSQFGVIVDGGKKFFSMRTTDGFNLVTTGELIKPRN